MHLVPGKEGGSGIFSVGVSGEENGPFEALHDVRQHTVSGLNVRTNATQATEP